MTLPCHMVESTSEKIDRFCEHFGGHIDQIAEDIRDYQRGLYAGLLLTAMIDTFAKVAFPSDEKVGRRFAKFVVEYSDWSDARRVSLIHLGRVLELDSRMEFEEIRQWVGKQIHNHFPIEEDPSLTHHPSEVEKPISADPFLSEVKEYWPNGEDKPLHPKVGEKKLDLRHLAHAGLLYQYRNHLVHEFQTPGRGINLFRKESPFYERVSEANFGLDGTNEFEWSLEVNLQRWELIYPVGFLLGLCRECLKNLHLALQSENRNPYSVFSEGTYWIPRLN